jgi:hypothetical protein
LELTAVSVAVSFSAMREMSLQSELLRRGRGESGPALALPFKKSCLVDCARIVRSIGLLSSLSFTMKGFDGGFPFSTNWGPPLPVTHLRGDPGFKGLASFIGNDNLFFPWGSGDNCGDLGLTSRPTCSASRDPFTERAAIRSFLDILGGVTASVSELFKPLGSWSDPEEVSVWTRDILPFAAASPFSLFNATLHTKFQITFVQQNAYCLSWVYQEDCADLSFTSSLQHSKHWNPRCS